MSASHNLTKAKISQHRKLMKTDAAKKYLKKKQLERGGAGNGFYKTKARSANGEAPATMQKADGKIRTINDMIDYWYGFVPDFYSSQGVTKQDSPVLSSTDGYRNAVFGSEVFYTIN